MQIDGKTDTNPFSCIALGALRGTLNQIELVESFKKLEKNQLEFLKSIMTSLLLPFKMTELFDRILFFEVFWVQLC